MSEIKMLKWMGPGSLRIGKKDNPAGAFIDPEDIDPDTLKGLKDSKKLIDPEDEYKEARKLAEAAKKQKKAKS